MGKIDDMIKKYGDVPKVKFDEICDFRNGYTPSKSNSSFWDNGSIPWYRMEDIRIQGRILSEAKQYITENAIRGKGLFKANSIILATTATIGEHALLTVDALANQRLTNIQIKTKYEDRLLSKFLFYYMFVIDEWCKQNTNISGFASVDMQKLKSLLIPLPPLEVQEEIVSVLDHFSQLQSELEEELLMREKQFEYYRELLLTPKNDWKECKLGDFLNPLRGKRLTKKQLDDSNIYPVYHGGLEPIGYYDKSNREKDTVMIINVGASAGTVGYSDKDFWSSDGCFCLSKNNDLNTRFVYFYLQLNEKSIKSKVRVAGIPTLDSSAIMNIDFSFPPIDEQKRIVGILDKFDKLINDKNEGLQKEIELRKKQYEYYRNKLLTF